MGIMVDRGLTRIAETRDLDALTKASNYYYDKLDDLAVGGLVALGAKAGAKQIQHICIASEDHVHNFFFIGTVEHVQGVLDKLPEPVFGQEQDELEEFLLDKVSKGQLVAAISKMCWELFGDTDKSTIVPGYDPDEDEVEAGLLVLRELCWPAKYQDE